MSKRRYTKIQMLLPVIEGMIADGMSHREIEKELGLEGDRPIHNLLKRQRRKAAEEIAMTMPWRKTSSLSSKQSASTDIFPPPLTRQEL